MAEQLSSTGPEYIYIYISTGTDIYLYIQEAPVSYAWNRVCFVHWGDYPFLAEHSPWLFGSKKSSSAQSELFWMCCNITCVPSRLISRRWHLNLSAIVIAIHRYMTASYISAVRPASRDLSFLLWIKSPNRKKKEKWKWLVFRQICNLVLCFLNYLFEA